MLSTDRTAQCDVTLTLMDWGNVTFDELLSSLREARPLRTKLVTFRISGMPQLICCVYSAATVFMTAGHLLVG